MNDGILIVKEGDRRGAIDALQAVTERVLGSFCRVEQRLRLRAVLVILSKAATMCLLLEESIILLHILFPKSFSMLMSLSDLRE